MTATKKKRAPQPTQGQIAMLYEVQRGMPYVPTMGQRRRCWESMLGLWVQVQDGRPALAAFRRETDRASLPAGDACVRVRDMASVSEAERLLADDPAMLGRWQAIPDGIGGIE